MLLRLLRLSTMIAMASAALAAPAAPHAPADPHDAAPAAAHDDHHTPGIWEGGIGNSLITLIVFGGVVLILGRYAWPKVLDALEQRETFIREALQAARTDREQAAALLTEYQVQLDRARAEATAIVDEGRRDADAARQRILEDARRETAEMVDRARREVRLATDAAVKELFDRTSEFSMDVASRVLGKTLSPEDHRRLIDESIAEIRAQGRALLN